MNSLSLLSPLLCAASLFLLPDLGACAQETEPVRSSAWTSGMGSWSDATHWDHGVPIGIVRASLRGKSDITIESGRQVVGGLTVGTASDEDVKLRIKAGELIVRRNFLQIGEADRSAGDIILENGVLECVGATYLGGANNGPDRQIKGGLHIRGGTFVTREMFVGCGPGGEATLAIEGSRVQAVHMLDAITLGTYQDKSHSTSILNFTLDEHGVTPITIQGTRYGLSFMRQHSPSTCRLQINLSAIPPREDIPLIVAHAKPKGEFNDLPEGAEISATFQGRTFHWKLTYRGGQSGCDVALTKIRGHQPEDAVTHARAIPAPPPILWTQIPLREPLPTNAELAFDGAEGFGAIAKGGRGGQEIAVENLSDSGPGSLRAAIETKGPRIIVFRVAGTIELKTLLAVRHPFISILGQSAPSPGITLRGHGMTVMTNDVILRYLRIRPGQPIDGDDALEFYDAQRCIVDHCSFAWGGDETCSVVGLSDAITVQHCILAEGLNNEGHSMASIAGGERISWHHNLLAHCRTRNPRFADVVCCDFRNNVVYDWGDTAAYGEFERVNFIANWYKPGPSTTQKPLKFYYSNTLLLPATFFVQGNVMEGQDAITKNNWLAMDCDRNTEAPHPFASAPVRTETAADAYAHVLDQVGATQPTRDSVDKRIISSVRDGTGKIIRIVEEAGDEK